MNLTYQDFQKGKRLYQGKLKDRFYFNGTEIFKLSTNEFLIRTDWHLLPIVGFFPVVEVYEINGKLVLVFNDNHYYTYVDSIKVFEGQMINQFTGFEPGKEYELTNNEIWRQVNEPYAPNHHSSGYVKIINDEIMIVDTWSFYPRVERIK